MAIEDESGLSIQLVQSFQWSSEGHVGSENMDRSQQGEIITFCLSIDKEVVQSELQSRSQKFDADGF